MANIEERVKQVIVSELGISPSEVTPFATFSESLGADELDVVKIYIALEEEFEVSFTDEEKGAIIRVSEVVDAIRQKLG